MRELLASMEDEVVTVELDKNYTGKLLDSYSPSVTDSLIDITVSASHTLDQAIKILQEEDYQIKSIKPKSGRLEEFFLKSTGK
jgi:hypothetical protein